MSDNTKPSPATIAVQRVYRMLLKRDPDAAGLAYHAAVFEKSGDILEVVAALTASSEFTGQHDEASAGGPASADVIETVPINRPITIVDIGAQRLSDQPHAYDVLTHRGFDLSIVGFEPLTERLDDRRCAEADLNLTLLPDFIGDGSQRTFHINNYDATSSLFPFNSALTEQFVELKDLHTVSTRTVQTRQLDDILPRKDHVDFLKLDIQGFELEALRGAESLLQRTSVIHCEVSFAEIYERQCLFSEIETFLRDRGFDFIDLVHPHRGGYVVPSGRVVGDRLLWADAVFFRRTEALTPEARQVQAMIALYVYGKSGFAERLLVSPAPIDMASTC